MSPNVPDGLERAPTGATVQPPADRTCAHRWAGARPGVADSSTIHVCTRAELHGGPHGCGCGALGCACGHGLPAHDEQGACALCDCAGPW